MDRILVVDDEQTTLSIIRNVLKKENYEVDTFDLADKAVEAFDAEDYSMVISDYFMPGMDGADFLDAIRKRDSDIPFVFLTANTDVRLAIELVKKGADDHITKPIFTEELLFRVRKNFREKEYERTMREAQRERDLLDLENQKLVNWRTLYASKDISQTEQMIRLLSRSINQAGGYLWLDLLKGELENPEDGYYKISKDLAEMIVNTAENQKNIFDYITFISTLDNIKLDKQSMEAADFISLFRSYGEELLAELTKKYPRTYLSFVEKEPLRGKISVDSGYFKKVLKELIINAIKYSPENSRVLLFFERNTTHPEGGIDISVRNRPKAGLRQDSSGRRIIGIPYDYSELVFDLFYTIESYPRQIPEEEWSDGTGLFVCRKLLRKMNGWIKTNNGVDYTGEKPETFVNLTVTLPVEQESGGKNGE